MAQFFHSNGAEMLKRVKGLLKPGSGLLWKHGREKLSEYGHLGSSTLSIINMMKPIDMAEALGSLMP